MDLFGFGNKPNVVAAIGLGDSRVRYGYVYKTTNAELATSFRGIHVPEDRGPPIVLLTSDRKFHSIGRDAESFYRSLTDEVKDHYCLIKDINDIKAHTEDKLTVKDTKGRQHDPQTIFSDVFVYFRKLIEDCVRIKHNRHVHVGRWVVYIPGQWSPSLRMIVTTAAENAGMILMRLRVVTDTEAAFAICRYGDHRAIDLRSKILLVQLDQLKTNISILEYEEENIITELYTETVSNLGEATVSETLNAFMKSLIGSEIWEQFESNFPVEHRSLIESFIEKSRTFSRVISKDTTIYMPLDKTLQTYVTDQTGHSIETLIHEKYKSDESPVEYSYQTESEGIIFNLNIMEIVFMFVPVIKELIYETLRKAEAEAICKLWLVGEFAQSRYVREALEVEFSSRINMFYPLDCENAILKGALIMGKEKVICRVVNRNELNAA